MNDTWRGKQDALPVTAEGPAPRKPTAANVATEQLGVPGSSSAGWLGGPRSLEPWGPAPSTAGPGLRGHRQYKVAAKRTGGLPTPPRRPHAVVCSPLSPDVWSRGSVCCAFSAHGCLRAPQNFPFCLFVFVFLVEAPARPTMLTARKTPGLTGVEGSLPTLCVHRPPSSGQPHTPAWSCPAPRAAASPSSCKVQWHVAAARRGSEPWRWERWRHTKQDLHVGEGLLPSPPGPGGRNSCRHPWAPGPGTPHTCSRPFPDSPIA